MPKKKEKKPFDVEHMTPEEQLKMNQIVRLMAKKMPGKRE